jgi:hypothetical protein
MVQVLEACAHSRDIWTCSPTKVGFSEGIGYAILGLVPNGGNPCQTFRKLGWTFCLEAAFPLCCRFISTDRKIINIFPQDTTAFLIVIVLA